MNELIKRLDQLPVTIDKLHDFILVGKERLNAHKAKIRAIEKIESAHAAKGAALADAQDLGDVLLDAEAKLGEMIEKIPKPKFTKQINGSKERTTEKSLPPTVTKKESHFAQTIAKNPEVVEEVKKKARDDGFIPTAQNVLKAVQKKKQEEQKSESLKDFPNEKYSTIVIDPPWPTKKILREERPYQDSFDYNPFSIEKIKAIPIQDISNNDCHIYLWTTHKFLPLCFDILIEWGFKYQCLLTWIKNVGMTPFSWMYSTEHCLFGRKGNLPLLQMGKRLDFNAKVREHSRKPEIFYELVREVSPEPRIDIFSRERREGFDQYGNEKNRF